MMNSKRPKTDRKEKGLEDLRKLIKVKNKMLPLCKQFILLYKHKTRLFFKDWKPNALKFSMIFLVVIVLILTYYDIGSPSENPIEAI